MLWFFQWWCMGVRVGLWRKLSTEEFWTAFELWLEKTHESPLDCQKIQPVHSKGDQSWVFFGRTDAKAPILWPSHEKNWLIGKDPDAWKDWRQKKKGMTEYEIVGWHHWLNGHEFEEALGDGDGQASLACCSPWSRKQSDKTERLHNNKSVSGFGQKEIA